MSHESPIYPLGSVVLRKRQRDRGGRERKRDGEGDRERQTCRERQIERLREGRGETLTELGVGF